MLLVAYVDAVPVDIKGIGVLHCELPHAEQPGLRSWLVAKLGLNLVPDLRQVAIGTNLAAGDCRKNFLVGHAETHVATGAVFETKHVLAHCFPASAFLPEFRRMESREIKLLRAHSV